MKTVMATLMLAAAVSPAMARPCEDLLSLKLPNVTVTRAESVPGQNPYCRVAATLTPSSDSDIRMELWLPVSNWNGNFEANGNTGWLGSIDAGTLERTVDRGYATAMSDMGHEGASANFALGHPEKLIDFGYRAAHEMTVAAKTITREYYGRAPKYSYWNGCSAGGRSAMMEAQRYPNDYDGIVAGSPALNWTGRAVLSVRIAQAEHKDAASYIPPGKYPAIHKAALEACDMDDGVRDGVISNPMQCRFDLATIQCKGADTPECLTGSQVATARAIYSDVMNGGTIVAPGLERGSENGWQTMGGPDIFRLGADLFRFVVFKDPNWDYRTFRFPADIGKTQQSAEDLLNATNPGLQDFAAHGGKLIQYQGWSDPQIPPRSSVLYYESAVKAMGGMAKTQEFYRLFMVPGMAHCGGGDGASNFDMLRHLARWVENGWPPDDVIGAYVRNGVAERNRPICAYPKIAMYKGAGVTEDAANFECRVP